MDFSRDAEEEFAEEYAPMSDKELLDVAVEYEDLVTPAQAAMQDELKKRGLQMPEKMPEPEVPAKNIYDGKSNSELMEIARGYDALPEADQADLRDEFAARGLEPPLVEDEDESAQDGALTAAPSSDFLTVKTYRDLSAAYVARAYLEAQGIPNILRDENTIRTDWFLSNAIGGARLQVPSDYAERATELLSEPVPDDFEANTTKFVQPKCPNCGSLDVIADDMDRKVKAGSVVMFPLATPALSVLPFTSKADWKCMNCGCRWEDDEEPGTAESGANSEPVR